MRFVILWLAALLASPGSLAHPTNDADVVAVKAVLATYKSALERLDLTGVEQLFAPGNQVIESGKIEGTYADYHNHHIGPELGHFASFQFSDYVVDVHLEGSVALATESYRYTIQLKDKPEPIERLGVATTLLSRIDGQWRIVSMHNSSRAPKPKPPVDAAPKSDG
jgi:uncharacterized protein (TIGR02246 family)